MARINLAHNSIGFVTLLERYVEVDAAAYDKYNNTSLTWLGSEEMLFKLSFLLLVILIVVVVTAKKSK